MSGGSTNKMIYPNEHRLPKFIVLIGCDNFGNPHEFRYIHEDEVNKLLMSLKHGIEDIQINFELEGGESDGVDGL